MSTRFFPGGYNFTVMSLSLVCHLLFQAPFAWVAVFTKDTLQQPYQEHAELSITLCIVTRASTSTFSLELLYRS